MLGRAKKKYGLENFTKEILYVFETEQEMNQKEAKLVTEEFCLRKDTYNLCVGGQGGFSYISRDKEKHINSCKKGAAIAGQIHKLKFINDLEFRKKTLENLAQYNSSPGFLNSSRFKGMEHSEETKLKMSAAAKLRKTNSQTGTIWITNGIDSRKIKLNELIPEGWCKGRKITIKN